MLDNRIVFIHSVDEKTLVPKRLIRYIKIMRSLGYRFVSVKDIMSSNTKKKCIALTIDDGYKNNIMNLLPILKKYNVPALLFISTGLLDLPANDQRLIKTKCYPDQQMMSHEDVNLWIKEGHEIGFHTHNHVDLYRLDEITIEKDFRDGMSVFKNNGWSLKYFAYPFGFIPKNKEHFESLLSEYSFENAFGVTWGKVNPEDAYYVNRVGIGSKEHTLWSVAKSIGLLDRYFFKKRVYKEQIK